MMIAKSANFPFLSALTEPKEPFGNPVFCFFYQSYMSARGGYLTAIRPSYNILMVHDGIPEFTIFSYFATFAKIRLGTYQL